MKSYLPAALLLCALPAGVTGADKGARNLTVRALGYESQVNGRKSTYVTPGISSTN